MVDSSSAPLPPTESNAHEQVSSEEPPVLRLGWLFRSTAIVGVLAAFAGAIASPGVRGNAPERLVVLVDRFSAALAYVLCGLLAILAARAVAELSRTGHVANRWRGLLALSAGIVVIAVLVSLRHRLPPIATLPMAGAATCATLASVWISLRTAHTRAVAVVLAACALSSFARIAAWEVAVYGGEHASPQLYRVASGIATVAVIFEGVLQLVAAVWIGTRSRLGQVFSSLAIGAALFLTWGASLGIHHDAPFWQAAMHNALADSAGTPPPFLALGPASALFACASVFLALVAVFQLNQPAVIACGLAFALLSRGAFDVPLRALLAVTAAVWLVIATDDGRMMWRSILSRRKP